jgi:hypothetical protein
MCFNAQERASRSAPDVARGSARFHSDIES